MFDQPTIMKKKRAILLFGSIAALVLGYVAWCARAFYLSVPVPELLEIPQEYRKDARLAVLDHGFTRPDPFRLEILARHLARPYDCSPKQIRVHHKHGSYVLLAKEHWHDGTDYLTFKPEAAGWQGMMQPKGSVTELNIRALKAEKP